MIIFNDEVFIGSFIVIVPFLGQYLFSMFKSLYGYTSTIHFRLKQMLILKKVLEEFQINSKK